MLLEVQMTVLQIDRGSESLPPAQPPLDVPAPVEPEAARAWRGIAARYHTRRAASGLMQLAVTLIPLLALLTVMYRASHAHPFGALLLAPVAAGFLLRTFVIMHDCAHGSFLPSRGLNDFVGFITGVLTFTPFGQWRRDHALHHAASGDLDRRGHGDVRTLTVREYRELTPRERLKYRLFRNPLVMFGLGPLYIVLNSRRLPQGASKGPKGDASVHATNATLLVATLALVAFFGIRALFLVYLPVFFIAGAAGIWLFYVQHQFEDTYWAGHQQWDYATAALYGSSYYRLPRILAWVTGNIGVHHIHHFDPRIASFNLGKCYRENPEFHVGPVLGLRQSFRTIALKLWDEEGRRMTGFDDALVH
ncbi:MAG: fatty acid desaturase [Gemmatimonadota bacterium]|nr:fatty acid desaturase [Gemmatimonadota bacterium]